MQHFVVLKKHNKYNYTNTIIEGIKILEIWYGHYHCIYLKYHIAIYAIGYCTVEQWW